MSAKKDFSRNEKTVTFFVNIRLTKQIPAGIIGKRFTAQQGSIAQLGEHLLYTQRVTGSSPVVPTNPYGQVVQLVRMPACHAGGRGFEPLPGRHYALVAQSVEQ